MPTVVDRLSRRLFLVGSFFIGAALLTALVILSPSSTVLAVILFATFALVLAAAANLEFIYPPELFPTEIRASGLGIVTAGSRIGSASSTFLLPLVLAGLGINVALFSCVAVLLIGGIVCWLWAPETRRESLVTLDRAAGTIHAVEEEAPGRMR